MARGKASEPARANQCCAFECNICLDIAEVEPVVTACGHLFCGECLRKWFAYKHAREALGADGRRCPVCKKTLEPTTGVIPIFGRGGKSSPATAAADFFSFQDWQIENAFSGDGRDSLPPFAESLAKKKPQVLLMLGILVFMSMLV
mmetsp:Transcript_5170/g.13494  ORF Transcript_5170/g.13494 Transcript_5170/m.13494 type:complete len:146 (-) Transcript_5170:191-628(-)|eukprot:CAMPEP_0198244224 /NCGR_PEP_ID=MMETSP1446-20131203/33730_1 /TAXON_ID=1461542 ORGANISM="Unidentified sp, Strain CCMP2111" /NCGR_SAMPLE_ID=MMETSP1446 /ASSEMBLY_ACC=CAM_ASM_001112 /LENGTH=145 /DNA_ID=CAMNT_0043928223 /DNA_START=235 /DNA_END=672 /DNA_ORIENTATION=-